MQYCSFKRFASFLELELKLYPISLTWLKENVPQYKLFQENFANVEGFEQAHVMNDGCEDSDSEFCSFFNYTKLDGNPLIIEYKENYSIDDVVLICLKTNYPTNEGVHYCFGSFVSKVEFEQLKSEGRN